MKENIGEVFSISSLLCCKSVNKPFEQKWMEKWFNEIEKVKKKKSNWFKISNVIVERNGFLSAKCQNFQKSEKDKKFLNKKICDLNWKKNFKLDDGEHRELGQRVLSSWRTFPASHQRYEGKKELLVIRLYCIELYL